MKVLVHDWETTGLPLHPDAPLERQPHGIEWGGILFDTETQEQVAELEVLINPVGVSLDPKITKITGLTDEDLRDKPPIGDVLPLMRPLFEKADALLAHNAPFDRAILEFELRRCGIEDWPWPARDICTVQEHAAAWGRRPRLLELYQHYTGTPLEQTHRALDDVRALFEVATLAGILDAAPQDAEATL